MSPRVLGLECLRCHTLYDDPRLFTGCPRCAAAGVPVNCTVKLDLSASPRALETVAAGKGLWRFGAMLPITKAAPVTLGEGGTPLIHLERLGAHLGLPRLYVKDESQNP